MRLRAVFPLSALLLARPVPVQGTSSRNAAACEACYGLADHVLKRMEETAPRANEPINIGKRINAAGDAVPNSVVLYGESYVVQLS